MTIKERQDHFVKVFTLAQNKYSKSSYRLAGEGWPHVWQTLIATIMSAQTRDETTIPVAEELFRVYPELNSLSKAKYEDVRKIISRLNYCNTKAKHIIETAQLLIEKYHEKVPDTIDELITLPGVGRKTANLIITECFNKDGICVDTHVHRISNVLGFVRTKSPSDTELALMEVVPKKFWSQVNRIFVLWGKDVTGYDADKFLASLNEETKFSK
jgi:endonuclease-3